MKIVFLTMHVMGGPRKVSFTTFAEKAAIHGEDVKVITIGYSLITVIKNKLALKKPITCPANVWTEIAPNLQGFFWRSLWHPAALKLNVLNRFTEALAPYYPSTMPKSAVNALKAADAIVIESGMPILFIERARKLNPTAKLVYRASDRLKPIKAHPMLQRMLDRVDTKLDLIVTLSEAQLRDFSPQAHAVYISQGIDKKLFEADVPSPFKSKKNAISVGDMLFDETAITTMANNFPEWTFHLFGNGARLKTPLSNVVEHGEVPFDTLVAYFKHADIGIAPYRPAENIDYIAESSLKMAQYTYCRLPIVAPQFAQNSKRPHVNGYIPGDASSIKSAFKKASEYQRDTIDTSSVKSLDDTWFMLKSEIEKS